MHDLSIIGGGAAGLCASLQCARAGLDVLLVEGNTDVQWRIGETLSPESKASVVSLKLWDEFSQVGHLPCYGNASAWGGDGLAETDFIFNPYGNAWQLDRAEFEKMLSRAAKRAGATIESGQIVSNVERVDGTWRIKLPNKIVTSNFVIDATGRRSAFARSVAVKREVLDQLVAIYSVAISSSCTDQDSRTFIESCPDGWWYSALMPSGRRTVSFQTDADLLPGQEWRRQEWFMEHLGKTHHISNVLEGKGYEFPTPPQLTSAHSGRLAQFSGDGWLSIGDAAMSFDPLSGQGILKAMQSGIKAAEVVINGTLDGRAGFDLWNAELWEQFSRSRTDYYAMERRWPESVFWQRRHGSG